MTERPKHVLPKPVTRKIQRPNRSPDWDFKKYGLLYSRDIDEPMKLKREDRATFKLSERAQAIVAWWEQSCKRQIALGKALAKGIPQPFRDLSIAGDRKLKPKRRLAAIERFKRLFGHIPMNVGVALFNWLNGGPKSEIIRALDRTVVTLHIDSKTGALAEADGRGRKKSSITNEKLTLVARRQNEGMSQREMSSELFPGLPQQEAYARTRDLFLKHRYHIELVRYRLLQKSRPARKPRR
jgi:hypothetical protein